MLDHCLSTETSGNAVIVLMCLFEKLRSALQQRKETDDFYVELVSTVGSSAQLEAEAPVRKLAE